MHEEGEEQRAAALVYQGRTDDDSEGKALAHRESEYSLDPRADLCHGDVLHRRVDGGTGESVWT